jgi:hypothetical protein
MWGGAAGAAAGGAAATGPAGGQPWTPTGPNAQAEQKKSRVPVIIAIVIALVAAVAAFFLVSNLLGGSDAETTIDNCVLEADGTMTVDGTITSESDVDGSLEVRFDDAESGEEVDRTTVEVKGDAGEDIPFSATGEAGDDVSRIDCVVVAPD